MSRNTLKLALAFAVMLTAWVSVTQDANAAQAQPEWSCQKGSGYCCDCVWTTTYRQCNALAEPGNYYAKCGVADDTPCTGDCTIAS